MAPVLELRGITKRFPGVLANDNINLTLEKGEIHALLGENGAGKTTLMNILYGLYAPDEGDVFVNGKKIEVESPSDAIAAGIGMVHQHFMLIPVFTVTENVMLGDEGDTPNQRLFGFKGLSNSIIPAILASILLPLMVVLPSIMSGTQVDYGVVISGFFLMLALLLPIAFLIKIPKYLLPGILTAFLISTLTYMPIWATVITYLIVTPLVTLLINGTMGFLNRKKASDAIVELSTKYNLKVDPDAMVEDLPVGVQQRVEIIKLLYREADILILDEPTAVLTPQEADELFKIMHTLVDQGKSIIFITHKLREVLEFADRITVIRAGKVIGTVRPDETNRNDLAAMMVGRDVSLTVEKDEAKPQDDVLHVENLSMLDDRDQITVDGISFSVRAGEILGVAGVQGNGQTELVRAITGLQKPLGGKITLLGTPVFGELQGFSIANVIHWLLRLFFGIVNIPIFLVKYSLFIIASLVYILGWPFAALLRQAKWKEIYSALIVSIMSWELGKESTDTLPRTITELGTGHIPEDRQKDGLVLNFPVADNLVLNTYYIPPFANAMIMDAKKVEENAVELIRNFDIRTPSHLTSAGALSGGNQQKVIVAREFARPTKLMVAAQPTRGLDVGSIEYIHNRLIEKRDEGCAVLLVSTELDEIMQLSDRIAVMFDGKINAIVDSKDATKEKIGLLMAGISPAEVLG